MSGKEKIKLQKNNEILLKPNALIKGVLEVNSNEYKAFNLILQKTQLDIQKNIDTTLIPVTIALEEFQDIYKDTSKNSLKKIGNSLEKLQKTIISWNEGKNIITGTLVGRVNLIKDNMTIKCYMDAKVVSVLKDYRKLGYSPINLKLTKKANGFYTQKLYELFRSWSNKEEPEEITIDELRKVLCLEGTGYSIYGNIKKRVLIPAIKEIQEKLNMKVDYKEILGARRKVVALEFTLEDKEPRHYTFKGRKTTKTITTKKAPEVLKKEEIMQEKKVIATTNYSNLKEIAQELQELNVNITETQAKYLARAFGQKAIYTIMDKMLEKIIVHGVKIEEPLDYVREEAKKLTKGSEGTDTEATKETVTTAIEVSEEDTTIPEENIKDNNINNRGFGLLLNLLKENNIQGISRITLEELEQNYGEEIFNESFEILIENSKQEKINNPFNYFTSILENKRKKAIANANKVSNSNSSKPSGFANFKQREYDYNKLEKQLLGWDDGEYDE